MALYYLYPDGTDTAGASWGPTGAATIHAAIDDVQGAPDDNTTYAQGSSASGDAFRVTLAPMVDVVAINSITVRIRYNNAGAGSGQELRYGIRVGTTDYLTSYFSVSSGTYADANNAWSTNPATSSPWTKPQLDDLILVAETRDAVPSTDSVRVTSFYVEVNYQPIPAGLAPAREIASQRLRRYRRPLEEARIDVGLDKLDLELMDDLSITHFAGPHASGLGWGTTNWKRRLHQLREESIDLNQMQMTIGTRGRRGYLCTFWDSAESRRSASASEDGVARLTSGGTLTYERNSKAWIPDPGSSLVTLIGINQKPIARDGLLMENFAGNLLVHSSAVDGATSVAGLTLAGTGVNGSAIAAESSPTEPLFESTVTNNCYKWTAGNPHAAALSATWPATATVLANTKVRFSIDHKDDSGATLQWRLTRSAGATTFWNDTTGAWAGIGGFNDLTNRTTRGRDISKVIDVGGTDVTLTLLVRQATGGTASRVNRVYHVQIEENAWATSHIVTTAAVYSREIQTYHIDNVSGARNISSTNGTFMCEFIPEWDSADMVTFGGFPAFFDMTYDANNWIRLYWNSGTTSLDFEMRASGVTVAATKSFVPVRGTTYKLAARWTSTAGELGLAARSLSVFVDGVKGTDTTRAADPTQSSVDLYIGGDSVGNALNGNLRRILFTQEVYTDTEIARFIS